MKAMVYERYGNADVLQVKTLDIPVIDKQQILIKVRATTVSSADVRMRKADPWVVRLFNGLFIPKKQVLGTEFSGEIASVGESVTQFKVGDRVFGGTGTEMGAHAEYLVLDETAAVTHMPRSLTFEQAASIPFGATASWYFLHHRTSIRPNLRILINGAGGALGSYGIQIAVNKGMEVTAVCQIAKKALVQSLGAHHVWDYTEKAVEDRTGEFDIIYDTIGHLNYSACQHLLTKEGVWLAASAGLADFYRMLTTRIWGRRKVVCGLAIETQIDMNHIRTLIDTSELKPVIDSIYEFDKLAEAHRRVEEGHKAGSVVVRL
ncbi:NAD(P)-dependent alcohol dehydrogenase [Vibrio sp. S9_S30]|uniref:NAD(P)-dependent alcohol dehydrogenase n=1 Tax=Vibrio sp. S9_S30 TaxID=2720226 RepID=UPI001680CE0C|nr:NAD(P)-dependent alcohol dehydrogenase [Vibrio sp. S9_S30]MBD1558105.1 NAD(P)-dependent alcohol dehydrogenase [Vibrio sp. S9_S30]